jgi:L-aminopeptidase/D-esterase-like protein
VLVFDGGTDDQPGAVAGVAVCGHAAGSRGLAALQPTALAARIQGLCLSGGSEFGLSTADGVVRVLAEHGRGLQAWGHRIPVVPAAILFDLDGQTAPPAAQDGAQAAELACGPLGLGPLPEGRVGAGAGARCGTRWRGPGSAVAAGFGGWSSTIAGGAKVAAGVAVNAFGGIRDPNSGLWLLGGPEPGSGAEAVGVPAHTQTTLAVVATDAALNKSQATILARMATAGLARALDPVFTPFDGDVVFAVATGTRARAVEPLELALLGEAAATTLAHAIVRVAGSG